MAYKEKAPIYEVLQWDGTNAQEVCDLWGLGQEQQFVWEVEPSGDLRIGIEGYFFITVPASNYAIAGPIWGTMAPQAVSALPPEQFEARFEQAQ